MTAKQARKTREYRTIDEFKREIFPSMVRYQGTGAKTIGTGLAAEVFAELRKKRSSKKA